MGTFLDPMIKIMNMQIDASNPHLAIPACRFALPTVGLGANPISTVLTI
jgi:hypothetical protein